MEILEEIEFLKKQENDLQFDKFDSNTALEIGNILAKRAMAENLPIVIDISICKRSVFRFSATGATKNNDCWIERKDNTVYLMDMSSLRYGKFLESQNKTLGKNVFYDPFDYATAGGGFPIRIKGTGLIGVIAVSGLPAVDDHQVIVDAITEHLKK
ncbi:MAG: heme-degrading domain-containing protein [Clostridia bacterium]